MGADGVKALCPFGHSHPNACWPAVEVRVGLGIWFRGGRCPTVPRVPRATPAAAGGATCRHQCLVWPGSSCSPACCHHRCCRQQQGVRASEGSKQGQAWPYFMTDRPVARPQAGRRRRRRGVGVDCVAQEANTIMCICHVLKLAVHVA